MSREVQLTYPRLRLFKNCIFTTPSGRAEYSISTNLNRGCCGRTTKIYALSPPTYTIEEEHAIDNEKGASVFNEHIGTPVGGKRGGPIANGKSVVAEINFRPPFRRHLTVEVPNRQRMGTAAVGPMRRNMRDLFIRNVNGESVVLDIGGRISECVWIRRNYHVRELRLISNNALVAHFQDDEGTSFIGGKATMSHITIYTDVVANYITHAYSDRTPRIFAATAMHQDIVDEVLVAYLLYRRLRCGGIVALAASFFRSLLCVGRSNAATPDDDDLEYGKPVPRPHQATRRAASY